MHHATPLANSGSLNRTLAAPATGAPRFSIIIPVLDEERGIVATLQELQAETAAHAAEVIVVDGGSRDGTRELVRQAGAAQLIESAQANRGWQMNEGAQHALGTVLLFLHADVRLPPGALSAVAAALSDEGVAGGAFQICFPPGAARSLGLVAWGINLRTRIFRTATGDQAIFVRRHVFDEIGGYQSLPLMEDIALFNEIKQRGRVAILDARLEISPRRWLKHGIWRTVGLMYALRFGYWLGISPATLKRFFVDVR